MNEETLHLNTPVKAIVTQNNKNNCRIYDFQNVVFMHTIKLSIRR